MKRLRILVVEDDAVIGMLLGDMLTEMGHTVCAIATREAEAVAAAVRHQPDLMILDSTLGHGSGEAVVDAVGLTSCIAHLFTTGDLARIRRARPGAIAIQKPYNEHDLAGAIALATA